MMWIEIVDILAGNYIDFSIPIGIEFKQRIKLLLLLPGKRRKIGFNTLHFRLANLEATLFSLNRENIIS